MKFTIAKLRHERFGQSSERSALLDQLELQLTDMEEDASEAEAATQMAAAAGSNRERHRIAGLKPARRPFPEHLPRERIVYPVPAACPCCAGALHKTGQDVTETLDSSLASRKSPRARQPGYEASSFRSQPDPTGEPTMTTREATRSLRR